MLEPMGGHTTHQGSRVRCTCTWFETIATTNGSCSEDEASMHMHLHTEPQHVTVCFLGSAKGVCGGCRRVGLLQCLAGHYRRSKLLIVLTANAHLVKCGEGGVDSPTHPAGVLSGCAAPTRGHLDMD